MKTSKKFTRWYLTFINFIVYGEIDSYMYDGVGGSNTRIATI